MRLRILGIISLVLFCLPVAMAQWEGKTVHVTIPFDFFVGDTQLPAGDYQFTHNAGTQTIDMTDRSGHALNAIHVDHEWTDAASPKTHLTFLKEADRYTLHMVHVQGEQDVHNVRHGKQIADITVLENE